ncbi:MAG TPA: threonine--tRNA ligase [Candidatus Bathyarchaeia archaeon]|nr:threonine--tRNA ligase [Candidatus Bathyarchaeia archaeon]
MKNQPKIEIIRHSLSHVLAAAVFEMFPDACFGIGPAIENGFYYDFDLPRTLIPEDLEILEEKMRNIIKENHKFERANISIAEAVKDFKKAKQPLKIELIKDIAKETPKAKTVLIYRAGNFVDLCAGPHIDSTGEANPKAFKLTKISGAYWKGDEKNKMLQRIYGVAFATDKELRQYLAMMAEAEKRDHRKIGKGLDLFCFSDLVGPGLPLFSPKGTIIIDELQKHVESVCRIYGFEKVSTPHLAKIDLFEKSGHKQKFGEELFHVSSHHKQDYVLKPVQCPHQTQIYASKIRSYRDLPIRYMESNKQFRDEKPGEISGLSRVIAITVEDGHSFCRIDQVKDELKGMVKIIRDFYKSLGLWNNHWVSLSVRDYAHPEKYIGDKKDWDLCEKMLQEVSDEMKLDAKKQEGEAALYGPKLDFMFRDAMGKEIQIPTVQVDFATPKRFDLTYIDKDGKEKNPVMVHRAILGSYERFLVLLIEHFAGAFPLWLSPVQVEVIPVSEKFEKYGKEILNKLKENNIRVAMKEADESLGKRIRTAQNQKVNYMLVVGEKEMKSKTVAVRDREKGDLGAMKIEKLLEKLKKEIVDKK